MAFDEGYFWPLIKKKSCIWETSNLLTDADRSTDTILESLHDLSRKKEEEKNGAVDVSTRPRVHAYTRPAMAPRGGDGRSAPIFVFRAPGV